MKTRYFLITLAISLIGLFSCKKSNNQATTVPISHWIINGVTDSSSTVSAANNMNFVCMTSDQLKSISIDFFSKVVRSYTYKVSSTLNDSTECTLSVNDNTGLIYTSTGLTSDSLHETLSNNIITLTFNNITVHNSTTTALVSGVLNFQSVY
ncbi:MAG TPA: hypothetical protein VK772_13535 [Puia sp.]|jgi:hypothetical protein|nr:hypothetical protein [Puia sp.]